MRQNILGASAPIYRKKLIRHSVICVAVFMLTLALNILLTALRTPENHTLLLTVNILLDIGCGWFLLFFLSTGIIPRVRLLRLMQKEHTKIRATLEKIAPEPVRYMNLDCRRITAGGHIFFLPAGAIKLTEGQQYCFYLTSNTVVEVET